jgi:hypothetical protein
MAGSALGAVPGSALAACTPGWRYASVSIVKQAHVPTTDLYRNRNGTGSSAKVTFTAQETGTVGMSVSIGAKANAGVILASAETSLNIDFSASMSTTIGNSIQITVPAGWYGYGQYGVWRTQVKGIYYYLLSSCAKGTFYGTVYAWLPRSRGWNTWTSST